MMREVLQNLALVLFEATGGKLPAAVGQVGKCETVAPTAVAPADLLDQGSHYRRLADPFPNRALAAQGRMGQRAQRCGHRLELGNRVG